MGVTTALDEAMAPEKPAGPDSSGDQTGMGGGGGTGMQASSHLNQPKQAIKDQQQRGQPGKEEQPVLAKRRREGTSEQKQSRAIEQS